VRAPVSPLQPLNALSPIVVTAEGMVRAPVSQPQQSLNASFGIDVHSEGMVREPSPLLGERVLHEKAVASGDG
jgi:hypothetical protein